MWGLKNFITMRHLENMNKIILLTGSIVAYAYTMEFFVAWYSGSLYESFAFVNRAIGQHWWAYAIMIFCNVVSPQLFWFKKCRTSIPIMYFVVMCVTVGMWFERFVIVVTSLEMDFLPSSWAYFKPTWVDLGMLAGSIGLFLTLFLLFIRYLPVIAMAELKAVMPQANPHGHHGEKHEAGRAGEARA